MSKIRSRMVLWLYSIRINSYSVLFHLMHQASLYPVVNLIMQIFYLSRVRLKYVERMTLSVHSITMNSIRFCSISCGSFVLSIRKQCSPFVLLREDVTGVVYSCCCSKVEQFCFPLIYMIFIIYIFALSVISHVQRVWLIVLFRE